VIDGFEARNHILRARSRPAVEVLFLRTIWKKVQHLEAF
jgi:hypothetical protein